MSSKITEAIEQLTHDVASLCDAIPSMQEAAEAKAKQVETLREKYLTTHPEILSGKWNLDISLTQDHARLTGWNYDINGTRCEGGDSGNFLVAGLGITDDEFATVLKIPYSDEEPVTCVTPQIQLSVVQGGIRMDFYNIDSEEVFRFIKERNIIIETPDMDKQILGFKERIEEVTKAKQAVIDAGLIKAEPQMFIDCTTHDTTPREVLMHTSASDDLEPTDEDEGIQFNAEQVAALHKHVGVSYDTLTDILTWIRSRAGSVNFETLVRSLEFHQTELDQISVEVGDLDTKDEPLDLGMAGSAYWNMLQGAMYHLGGTLDYIEKQDNIPLFAEVQHRLKQLAEILERCSDEFGDTYLGGKHE